MYVLGFFPTLVIYEPFDLSFGRRKCSKASCIAGDTGSTQAHNSKQLHVNKLDLTIYCSRVLFPRPLATTFRIGFPKLCKLERTSCLFETNGLLGMRLERMGFAEKIAFVIFLEELFQLQDVSSPDMIAGFNRSAKHSMSCTRLFHDFAKHKLFRNH